MKCVEYSENETHWTMLGIWTDEEAETRWPNLQHNVDNMQLNGFFRIREVDLSELNQRHIAFLWVLSEPPKPSLWQRIKSLFTR